MVSSSCVLLATRGGVGHVQISPVAYVRHGLAVVVEAGTGGLVAFTHVPFVADVAGRELPLLLLLTGLAALGSRV